ncbi:hypothetical protein BKP56_11320 [Marinilactibacillus sp. 15R]|uniref:Triosephosphate isomerase n=1 Tax=Marinilactibacillus piezotolerans TaxID=258723 RepID=A0A1I4AH43_9LACT|nr:MULTISPECIES: triose-phosphate isomerase family protein [Marinilactibacillus]API89813.1 hypothetical protein BKP56_11320 [Marinilactibacillus sp. 15R]SFK55782.1 triosephosphate isomerase [Marinilactibacillus piezotolerans]
MTRKPKVGISMKLYQNLPEQAIEYAKIMKNLLLNEDAVEVFYLPTATSLYPVANELNDSSILYGSQNIAPEANGAYTGEISIEALKELNCSLVEIGHYERRTIFQENNKMIADKITLTLEYGLSPILCLGEVTRQIDSVKLKSIFYDDLNECLAASKKNLYSSLIIAYEPFWAIGKEKAADADYVHRSHQLIRECLTELLDETTAELITIIYGGSVSKNNAYQLTQHKDVDGLFVGRFGHDPNQLLSIVDEVKRAKKY